MLFAADDVLDVSELGRHRQRHSGVGRRIDELARRREVEGERLLAQHGDAALDEIESDLDVGRGRGADHRRVDLQVREELVVGRERRAREGFAHLPGPLEGRVGDADDARVPEPAEDRDVGLGDGTGADEREPQHLLHGDAPTLVRATSSIRSAM